MNKIPIILDKVSRPHKLQNMVGCVLANCKKNGAIYEATIEEIAEALTSGHAIIPAVLEGGFGKKDWKAQQLFIGYFVVNGDTGVVVDKGIDEKGKGYLLIKFYADTERETDKKIHFDDIDRYVLDHADCITVHKSQGSQYEDVTVIIPDNTKASISINLFYTAISRAKNKVRIFVNKEKLLEIFKSCPEDRRTIVRLLNRKISQ